jgi:hypothetical protein
MDHWLRTPKKTGQAKQARQAEQSPLEAAIVVLDRILA